MARLVKVAQVDELPPGKSRAVTVEGKPIALFNAGGELCALDGKCSHVGGPLGHGAFDGAVVTCPWHRAQFEVRTGKTLSPHASNLACHKLVVQGDEIFMELP